MTNRLVPPPLRDLWLAGYTPLEAHQMYRGTPGNYSTITRMWEVWNAGSAKLAVLSPIATVDFKIPRPANG